MVGRRVDSRVDRRVGRKVGWQKGWQRGCAVQEPTCRWPARLAAWCAWSRQCRQVSRARWGCDPLWFQRQHVSACSGKGAGAPAYASPTCCPAAPCTCAPSCRQVQLHDNAGEVTISSGGGDIQLFLNPAVVGRLLLRNCAHVAARPGAVRHSQPQEDGSLALPLPLAPSAGAGGAGAQPLSRLQRAAAAAAGQQRQEREREGPPPGNVVTTARRILPPGGAQIVLDAGVQRRGGLSAVLMKGGGRSNRRQRCPAHCWCHPTWSPVRRLLGHPCGSCSPRPTPVVTCG